MQKKAQKAFLVFVAVLVVAGGGMYALSRARMKTPVKTASVDSPAPAKHKIRFATLGTGSSW